MQKISNIIASIKFDQKTSKLVVNGSAEFKVWVETIFNQDIYETTLITDLSFVKESEYEYTVTADNSGFNTIELQLSNKAKTKTTVSNTLLAIVE